MKFYRIYNYNLYRDGRTDLRWSGKVVIYGGRSAVAGGGCVCYSSNDNHVAAAGDRGRSWSLYFPFQKQVTVTVNNWWQCSLSWYYFAVSPLYLYVTIPCSSPHIIFCYLVNIKLHCSLHHCRACFSFSGGLHVNDQIWPNWRSPNVLIIILFVCQGRIIICIFVKVVNLIWYLYLFLLNRLWVWVYFFQA